MRTSRFSVLSAVITLIITSLACNALDGRPSLSNIRMATDETGVTTTISYAPGDAFYVFADLNGLRTGSVVEAKWYAVDIAGEEPNSEINTSDYTHQADIAHVYFKLTTPDGSDWPVGSYKVDLYLDGTLIGSQTFSVQ